MYDLFFDSNLLTLSSRQKRKFLYNNSCDIRETKFTFTDNIYLLVIPAL